jgi:hypothetical protein
MGPWRPDPERRISDLGGRAVQGLRRGRRGCARLRLQGLRTHSTQDRPLSALSRIRGESGAQDPRSRVLEDGGAVLGAMYAAPTTGRRTASGMNCEGLGFRFLGFRAESSGVKG